MRDSLYTLRLENFEVGNSQTQTPIKEQDINIKNDTSLNAEESQLKLQNGVEDNLSYSQNFLIYDKKISNLNSSRCNILL